MPDAGWYPDAQDPNWQLYFDGQYWTGERQPVGGLAGPAAASSAQTQTWQPAYQQPAYQQPAYQQPQPAYQQPQQPPDQLPPWQQPSASWAAPAAATPAPGWPAPAHQWAPDGQAGGQPPRRRNRKPLLLVLGAVVLLAAGLTAWLVWPKSAPQFTYSGKEISSPATVLTAAEAKVSAAVKKRHGVQSKDTRCYFAQPKKHAAGAKASDVDKALRCGPVLFVDGDSARQYLAVPVARTGTSGGKAKLAPQASLDGLEPVAVGTDVKLARPDGKAAAKGDGGLTPPKPPAAAADALLVGSLGPTTPPASVSRAVMVGSDTRVTLQAAGVIGRYGSGDAARSPAAGQRLIAFKISYGAGDLSGAARARAKLLVGTSARTIPEPTSASDWVIASVPTAGTAAIQLANGGYTQTLALPTGTPGANNLTVLTRQHRSAFLIHSFNIPVRLSRGSASGNVTLHAHVTLTSLDFWVPGHTTYHPSSPRNAMLSLNITYTRSGSSSTYGLDPALMQLRLPTGVVVHARNIASSNHIFNVFEVPGDFTFGDLQVTGSERVSGILLSVTKETSFTVRIAAG